MATGSCGGNCTYVLPPREAAVLAAVAALIPTTRTPHNPLLPQAFDQHLNMVLGDVEETVTITEVDEETDEEHIKVRTAPSGALTAASFAPL